MTGRLVDFSKEQIVPGTNEFSIDLSGSHRGVYYLHFLYSNELIQIKPVIFY